MASLGSMSARISDLGLRSYALAPFSSRNTTSGDIFFELAMEEMQSSSLTTSSSSRSASREYGSCSSPSSHSSSSPPLSIPILPASRKDGSYPSPPFSSTSFSTSSTSKQGILKRKVTDSTLKTRRPAKVQFFEDIKVYDVHDWIPDHWVNKQYWSHYGYDFNLNRTQDEKAAAKEDLENFRQAEKQKSEERIKRIREGRLRLDRDREERSQQKRVAEIRRSTRKVENEKFRQKLRDVDSIISATKGQNRERCI